MDKKRLQCKVCGFKSDDLVHHIESMHAAEAGQESPLVWYMIKYGVEEDGVIFKEQGLSGEEKIRGMPVFEGLGGLNVPEVNPHYYFAKHAEDILLDIGESKKIMLVGHTGTGKTSIVEQIAAHSNQGVMRVNLNGQTTIGDFVGLWTVKGGDMAWVDGALPKAMREGLWLILDEIDFAEPSILSNLNSVLEKNGKLMLKEKGHEVVLPHPNFRIFATANTVGCMSGQRGLYQGTNLMNEAFLDRFRCYHVDYLSPQEEIKVLVASIQKMTPFLAEVIVKVGGKIREAFNKGEVNQTFSLRRMLDWAELMVRYQHGKEAPHRAAEIAIYSKVSPEDKQVLHGIIQRHMISG